MQKLELLVKRLFIIKIDQKKGYRYKVITQENFEYRFYWKFDPKIIELEVINDQKIIFTQIRGIVWKEGIFEGKSKKQYKFAYYEILLK